MTNAQIIFNQSVALMKEGKIGTTGRMIVFEDESGKHEMPEPEPIHTYAVWKELGYQVQKGQKAVAAFPIWKYTQKAKAAENEAEAIQKEYCFMKMSHFFTKAQVEARA